MGLSAPTYTIRSTVLDTTCCRHAFGTNSKNAVIMNTTELHIVCTQTLCNTTPVPFPPRTAAGMLYAMVSIATTLCVSYNVRIQRTGVLSRKATIVYTVVCRNIVNLYATPRRANTSPSQGTPVRTVPKPPIIAPICLSCVPAKREVMRTRL